MKIFQNVFVSNTISLYLMNLVRILLPLVTIPYLARVFSTEVYGLVVYSKALMSYAQLFIDFGFLLSATRSIVLAADDKNKINKIVGDTLVEKTILSVMVIVFFVLLLPHLPILTGFDLFIWLSIFAVLSNVFILDFLFRGLELMHYVAVPYVIAKIISTIFTLLLIKHDSQLLLLPILDIIGNAAAILFSWHYKNKYGIRIVFSNAHIWIADLKESFIFFLSNFSTTIFGAFTTLIAGSYLPLNQLAYWGICMQLLSAAKALYSPITNSLYTQLIKSRDIKLVKRIAKFMGVPMLIGTAVVFSQSNAIMWIIGGEKYSVAGIYLIMLLPAFVFSFYSMLYGWPVLGAINKIGLTTSTTVVTSIIHSLLLIALIALNQFNLTNLACTCSISEGILFFLRYGIYWKDRKLFFTK